MKPAPRPVRPPARVLAVAAGVVAISGAALVAVPSAGGVDSGLSPRTVARHLAAVAPPGAQDVRISGVYGSGHRGTWQFTGFITWRDPSGTIDGGSTELPQHGGQPALNLNLPPERIRAEHALGLTSKAATQALARVKDLDAELAMVELAITADAMTIVSCISSSADTGAVCATYDASGRVLRHFGDRLFQVPGMDALSVQRVSAPVVATN